MIDVEEAAKQAGESTTTISKACREGRIPAHKEEKEDLINKIWVIEGNYIKKINNKYFVFDEKPSRKSLKKLKMKVKSKEYKCSKCVFSHKTSKENYYCPFRGCIYAN